MVKTVTNFKIKLNGLKLYPSRYIKYLGFLLDETLSDEVHIGELLKKLIRANAMLTKNQAPYPLKSTCLIILCNLFQSYAI